AVTINGIIGAGIFGLPSKVYGLIGGYSLIAFVVCALVVMLIILCFAEVGSRFQETGGPYLYAREAFGPAVAFEVGWLIWLARLTAFAANCNLMISYLSFFWAPANTGFIRASIIIAVVIMIILCFAEVGSRFQETGGPYLYAREAFGPAVAFEVGWLIWLARLTAFAANCNLMISYLSFFWAPANTGFIRASIIIAVVI